MTKKFDHATFQPELRVTDAIPNVTLAIGLSQAGHAPLQAVISPAYATVHHVSLLADLPDLVQRLQPSVVVSPLIYGGYDAHEIACLLSGLGFRGRYKVLAPSLPRAEMVLAEIASAARGIKIEIFDISTLKPA